MPSRPTYGHIVGNFDTIELANLSCTTAMPSHIREFPYANKKNPKARGINYQYWTSLTPEQPTLVLIMGYSGSIASWTEDFLDGLGQPS